MENRQIIDVDSYKDEIDLTQGPQTIDLTQDDETIDVTTPRPPCSPRYIRFMNNPYCPSPGYTDGNAKRKRVRNVPIAPRPDWMPGVYMGSASAESAVNYDGTSNLRPTATQPRKPKTEPTDVISLASDTSEGEVEDHLVGPVAKKPRQDGYNGYDSGDDYDLFLVGMNDEVIWKSLPDRGPRLDTEKTLLDEGAPPIWSPTYKWFKKQVDDIRLGVTRQNPTRANVGQTKASNAFNQTLRLFRTGHRHMLLPNMISLPYQRFAVPKGLGSTSLSRAQTFKRSPGCIMRVIQKEGWVVVCSACTGGGPDAPGETISPYNEEGSLIIWHDGSEAVLDGHRRPLTGSEQANWSREDKWKHYSVNDIKFDPTSTSFVSSGNDKKVRAWEKDPDSDEYFEERIVSNDTRSSSKRNSRLNQEQEVTNTRYGTSGKIHLYHDYQHNLAHDALTVVPQSAEHTVGGMRWGTHSTDGYLFASSEPIDDDCFDGYHKAFNVETGNSYEFDSKEAGDSIALTADGELLVHTSRGAGGKHPLRLYDVRRRNGHAIKTVHMDPFRPYINGEVNSISISPDGIYIAVARNDNRIQIYDTRMLAKGKMYEYQHKGKDLTMPGAPSCGVVEVRWAKTEFSRLALVSGGADGCVRLWDPLVALSSPMNGTALAQVNSDIAHFTLGDPASMEQQLVVGDSSGEATIFNGTKTYIYPQ